MMLLSLLGAASHQPLFSASCTPTNPLPGSTPTRVNATRIPQSLSKAAETSPNFAPGFSKSLSPDVISKYLVQYVPVKEPKPSQAANRVTGLRVLTSAEGLAILKEREDKKRREAQERNWRETRRRKRRNWKGKKRKKGRRRGQKSN